MVSRLCRRPALPFCVRSVTLTALAGVVAVRSFDFLDSAFVGGGIVPGQTSAVARRAGYSFDFKAKEEHKGLVLTEQEEGMRLSTDGSFLPGHWNTVLGDKELPASGRSYWEVKFIRKPSDAWEYIGVAEPSADVNVPLTVNRKGAGWFWGGNWKDSFVYTHLAMRKEWNEKKIKQALAFAKSAVDDAKQDAKEAEAQAMAQVKNHFTGPGTHVGQLKDWPTFEKGRVVGVDVDMNDGSVAFWADGKFLGLLRDTEGKPINLKGKKVVPAVSVFGRRTGAVSQNTVMEVRTGLEPPPRPVPK